MARIVEEDKDVVPTFEAPKTLITEPTAEPTNGPINTPTDASTDTK